MHELSASAYALGHGLAYKGICLRLAGTRTLAINSRRVETHYCQWSQQFAIQSFSADSVARVSDSANGTSNDDMDPLKSNSNIENHV